MLRPQRNDKPRRTRVPLLSDLKAVEVFVAVVQTQSITKAAKRLDIGASTVSKKLSELEGRAGSRLLNRTTRSIHVTETGERFFEHCLKIAESIEVAEAELWEQSRSISGRIKVAAPVVFARTQIAPLISKFLFLYPDIRLQMTLSPQWVDMIEEGIDVSIRIVKSDELQRQMKPIARNRRVFCASPAYLERSGSPTHPSQLQSHSCLLAVANDVIDTWSYRDGTHSRNVRVSGPLVSDNIEILRQAAIDGLGLAYLGVSLISEDLKNGKLQMILSEFTPQDSLIVAHLPHAEFVPQRVLTFIDYLKEQFGDPPIWESDLANLASDSPTS